MSIYYIPLSVTVAEVPAPAGQLACTNSQGGEEKEAGMEGAGERDAEAEACPPADQVVFVARLLCSRPGDAGRNHHGLGCKQQKCLLSWS